MNKFTYIKDDVFSLDECNQIISDYKPKTSYDENTRYSYANIESFDYIDKLMSTVFNYISEYPEINLIASKFGLTNIRFKHFKPGNSFNIWHSEHCITHAYRVLSVQLYLSEHNCGTKFYNGDYIQSKVGRVAIFPAYFTHTHKGETCPDRKDRYIITSYISFYEKGDMEKNNE
tara:strand:+ start:157 stop:678 length:522 start_codon:yes stop_codon:yes gene_type:complete